MPIHERGRYTTLKEVMDFYSQGLEHSPTVDPLMKQLSNGDIQLTDEEKITLVAF